MWLGYNSDSLLLCCVVLQGVEYCWRCTLHITMMMVMAMAIVLAIHPTIIKETGGACTRSRCTRTSTIKISYSVIRSHSKSFSPVQSQQQPPSAFYIIITQKKAGIRYARKCKTRRACLQNLNNNFDYAPPPPAPPNPSILSGEHRQAIPALLSPRA